MMSDNPSTDPLEAVLARCRPSAEVLFQRYALPPEEARGLLLTGLARIESLHGVVPGGGHRLLKLLEAACRRSRSNGEKPCDTRPVFDYRAAFEAARKHLNQRRRDRERERADCPDVVTEIEAWCAQAGVGSGAVLPYERTSHETVAALLDRAYELRRVDPRRSLALAGVTLDLLRNAPAPVSQSRLRWDLEARAQAFAGNAHRLLDDFRSAAHAFVAAEAALAHGTQDPRERALVLRLLATLRRDQRLFSESLRQFEQVAAIYRWVRERHLEGRIYSQMAIVHDYAGRPDLAILLAERAAELIDPTRDPGLAAGIEQNLTHFLCAAGRPEDARQRLARARLLLVKCGTQKELTSLRWIEAQIAFALGERDEGERLLLGVRDEFIAAGNRYDTALVSLELAAEYLDQGRSADARRLAAETLPIFQSLEVHREALAALIAVQRAIEMESATAELVRELLATLQRARNGPPPRPEQPS
jgi:tetratricopeptide (TPR) repeat protein